MYLRFSNREPYEKLHLTTGLEDWDMMEELKLATTADQYFAGADEKVERYSLRRHQSTELSPCKSEEGNPQECSFQPSLWLIVNPNLVMPNPEGIARVPPEPPKITGLRSPLQSYIAIDYSTMEDSEEESQTSCSELCTEDDDTFVPSQLAHKQTKCTGKKVRVQRGLTQLDSWPRPPINYCNLISLALRNSEEGSLNVQQIYSFVREHFPFFRVAPDGWKNTVRHNLCFSTSFEKSAGWVNADGNRRSCLWKLTRQGRRKFRTEMHSLSDELLGMVRRSMNNPGSYLLYRPPPGDVRPMEEQCGTYGEIAPYWETVTEILGDPVEWSDSGGILAEARREATKSKLATPLTSYNQAIQADPTAAERFCTQAPEESTSRADNLKG
ncbi:forkhead box protein R1 [Pelobates fuscus]|uniref:forkhead box protein R1 n=1 Tax=Pelobates fuscus TaxID=191477 RepID=UPI002FE4BEEB